MQMQNVPLKWFQLRVAPFLLQRVLDSLRNLFKFVPRTYAGSECLWVWECVAVCACVCGFCYHTGLGIMKCFNAFRPHKHTRTPSPTLSLSLSIYPSLTPTVLLSRSLVSQNSYQNLHNEKAVKQNVIKIQSWANLSCVSGSKSCKRPDISVESVRREWRI